MSDWRDDPDFDDDWVPQAPGEGVRVVGGDPAEPAPRDDRPSRRRPAGRFPLPGEAAPPDAPGGRGRGRPRAPDETPVELPHWTDPPTGQVPRVLGGDEDFEPWAQVSGPQGPRFRTDDSDWAAGDWAEGELA